MTGGRPGAIRRLLDDPEGEYALAESTHELLVRLLSALPLRKRPQLITTDGEFHTIRRQLDRLAEEGIEIIKVPAMPASTLAEKSPPRSSRVGTRPRRVCPITWR